MPDRLIITSIAFALFGFGFYLGSLYEKAPQPPPVKSNIDSSKIDELIDQKFDEWELQDAKLHALLNLSPEDTKLLIEHRKREEEKLIPIREEALRQLREEWNE